MVKGHLKPTVQRENVTLGNLSGVRLSDADATQDRIKWFLIHKHMIVLAFFEGRKSDIAEIESVLQHSQLTAEGTRCANNTPEGICQPADGLPKTSA